LKNALFKNAKNAFFNNAKNALINNALNHNAVTSEKVQQANHTIYSFVVSNNAKRVDVIPRSLTL